MRESNLRTTRLRRSRRRRRGTALIPTLVVVSSLAIFALAMVMATLNGARTVNHQSDEYRLESAVESVATLATEKIWSGYLKEQGGAAGDLDTFRAYLDELGVPDLGLGGPPSPEAGADLLAMATIPGVHSENPEFNDVNIESLQVVRRDMEKSSQLWVTAVATTNRGAGIVNPVLNRAVQQVYTIEPEAFGGFDYGLLANNVNCIFCHAQFDTVDRYYNLDDEAYGEFERVRVGALETLMVRHDMDGLTSFLNDYDADSAIAGTIYVRGGVTDHDGQPINDWSSLSLKSFAFDEEGLLEQDDWGDMTPTSFSPAGDPPLPFENLYLEYPMDYGEMVDGNLPAFFPAPFPDDGGIDPETGLMTSAGAGNKFVDDSEFYAVAQDAEGAITAGIIYASPKGATLDTIPEFAMALLFGNADSIQQSVDANVVLTGTAYNPITIDGLVVIDGDLLINGYIQGEGSIFVKGNVYIPTDLQYLDGNAHLEGDSPGFPTGPKTFGVAKDGTVNALGIAAGGNILIGDYLKPAGLQEDMVTFIPPWKYDYITGDEDDDWNFALAEMSLFNRGEWAKKQPKLPSSPGEANQPKGTWTLDNPNYAGPDYIPRYYSFGPGDPVPLYIKGDIYFDPDTGTWLGDHEVPLSWDSDLLKLADPNDDDDKILYKPNGTPKAIVQTLTPTGGWIDDYLYKVALEHFEDTRPFGEPMKIDGLIYTNNAIFTIVHRISPMLGRMQVNGSLVAADIGMLAPGIYNPMGAGTDSNIPGSNFAVGLRLNYDKRVKNMLNIGNPFQVQIKRTLWNPTANVL